MKIVDFRQLLAITRRVINVPQSVYMLLTFYRSVWVVTFNTIPKLSFFPFTSNENGDVSHTPNLHSIDKRNRKKNFFQREKDRQKDIKLPI